LTEPDKISTFLDNFINDFLNGDIEIIYSRAKNLKTLVKGKSFLGAEKLKDKTTVCNDIGLAITDYVETKSNPITHRQATSELFNLIVLANTHQVIKRTKQTNQIQVLTKENIQLKEEKDKLQRENQRLNLLNDALQNAMDRFGPRIDDELHSGEDK
jgi:hypothetical protein